MGHYAVLINCRPHENVKSYQGKLKTVSPAPKIDFFDFLWLTYDLGKVVRGLELIS